MQLKLVNVQGAEALVEGTGARTAEEQLAALGNPLDAPLGNPLDAHLYARSGERGRRRVRLLAQTHSLWEPARGAEQL